MKSNEGLRYRLGVASRAVAAILGGYALAAAATAMMALTLPLSRADAVLTATLLSFTVYVCAVIWVFAARTALRAWAGIGVPTLLLALGVMMWRGVA
ncbi:DUF3649 domain-containing protein [uncultured Oxalicibacterium sp.]|uniref:DUF3649 domain-containing protein n=1 Tax=uncultured Oxalicibacterium sp. TaxID=1168540 RepID=UPI0025DFF95A|nr:DUF3649 domain-containing protein [uncultured Oxalicibacterium sp.]